MREQDGTIQSNNLTVTPNDLKNQSAKPNYGFVDWIRMISMIGIIWAHTQAFDAGTNYLMLDNVPVYFFFMDFFKFGVICFFMISGFLLAGKIHTEPPLEYVKRRIYSTFLPYIFAFAGVILLFVFKTHIMHIASSKSLGLFIIDMLFDSAFWFLPSYWLSLILIMCFRKYLDSKLFGFSLLVLTLWHTWYYVYSVHAASHVHALFAFIFYLWLGYYTARINLAQYIRKVNLFILLGLFLLMYALTSLESVALWQRGLKEPLSILRLSNQLYSVIAFITMMRLFKKGLISRWINPRRETFGIYLYHVFALAMLVFLLKLLSKIGINSFSLNVNTLLPWFIAKFIFVYIITLLIVKVLLRLNIGFLNLVGRQESKFKAV